jgi:hypothetical protein
MRLITAPGILLLALLTLAAAQPAGRFYVDVVLIGGGAERVSEEEQNSRVRRTAIGCRLNERGKSEIAMWAHSWNRAPYRIS